MEDIRTVLQVKIESPYWDEAYEMALAEPEIPCWLDGTFLADLMENKQYLTSLYDHMVPAAKAILEVKELTLLVKVLKNILAYKNPRPTGYHDTYIVRPADEAFTAFELPKAPAGANSLAYESVSVFPIAAHVIQWIALMEDRGVDADVIRKTTNYWCGAVAGDTTRPVQENMFINYPALLYRQELFINPLRFQLCPGYAYKIRVFANENNDVRIMPDDMQMHRTGHQLGACGLTDTQGAYYATVTENEEYYEGHIVNPDTYLAEPFTTRLPKKQWRQVYQAGNDLVRIHLAGAAGFQVDLCEQAINRARETFARCFPEYDFRGITGYSWFMAPELIPVLKQTSNLCQFRQMFHMFPTVGDAKDSIYYVYGLEDVDPLDVDVDSLPEDNSMRRGVKEQMRKGNFVRNHGGYLLF